MLEEILKNKYINKLARKLITLFVFDTLKRRNWRKKLVQLLIIDFRDRLQKKYPDYYQFVLFSPWGDFNITCALLKSFKQKVNKKILVICGNNAQVDYAKRYSAIDKVIKIDNNLFLKFGFHEKNENFSQTLKIGNLYELSHWCFSSAQNNKSENFLELYAKMLTLTLPTDLERPKLPLDKNFGNLDKTILISPDARSFDMTEFDSKFWISLADSLSKLGFDIAFNSKTKKFGKYKNVFYNLPTQTAFALKCFATIGVRSGFNDILAINKAKNMIAIYPNNMYFNTITKEQQNTEFNRCFVFNESNFNKNMFKITSLNNMFGANTAFEVKFNDFDKMKQEIINYILEG